MNKRKQMDLPKAAGFDAVNPDVMIPAEASTRTQHNWERDGDVEHRRSRITRFIDRVIGRTNS